MRKFLLLSLAVAAMAPASMTAETANTDEFGRLKYVTYALGGGYTYNYQPGTNRVATVDEKFPGFDDVERVFTYDSRGNIIKDQAIQNQSGMNKFVANYAELEYDENDRLVTRYGHNYSVIAGGYVHSNTRDYTYTPSGQLSKLEVYLGNRSSIYETYTYTYDDNDFLVQIDHATPDDRSGRLLVSDRTKYTYDDNGMLIYFRYDDYYVNTGYDAEVSYDEAGNVTQIVKIDNDGNEVSINERAYHEGIDNSQIIYPYICSNQAHRDIYDLGISSPNPLEWETIWVFDQTTGEPFKNDIVSYFYEPKDDGSGIFRPTVDPIRDCGVNAYITGQEMRLDGVSRGSAVRIYDMGGRLVAKTVYNGSVNISSLASGIYTVATDNGVTKFSK